MVWSLKTILIVRLELGVKVLCYYDISYNLHFLNFELEHSHLLDKNCSFKEKPSLKKEFKEFSISL